jgi:hypothetical protein
MLKIFANFRNPDKDPLFDCIRDNFSDKPITLFYDIFPKNQSELALNPYNFLFIHEPNEFFGLHKKAIEYQSLFTGIFTWNDLVINSCSNSILFTYSDNSISSQFSDSLINKSPKFEVSFLCGTKNMVEGHELRHKVLSLEKDIKIPKKWFHVLDDYDWETNTRPGYAEYSKDLSHIPEGEDLLGYGRRILFKESMFNVVIENVNYNNWYNKIGDNFLTKTIPLYWGCPNIKEFGYDERGIIRFSNETELLQILNSLTPKSYYDMKPYIDHNYKLAKADSLQNNITNFFTELINTNNI